MSLIRIRRERKEQSTGPYRPPKLGKLLVGLVLVLLAIWYLSTFI
jgi:hypothetical protein